MKKLNVPYYSQRLDVKDPFWRPRSCGAVSIKMAMDFLGRNKKNYKKVSTANLIKEGISYEAHSLKYGWFHDGLIKIAKNHGFGKSFRKEWPEEKRELSLRYITSTMEKNIPVLASFKSKASGHLVLLVGFSDKGFFYHDPNSYSRTKGKFKFIATEKFLNIWKGRIIIVK